MRLGLLILSCVVYLFYSNGVALAWTEVRCSSLAQLTMLGPDRCHAGGCCWKQASGWGPIPPDTVVQCCTPGYMCKYGRPDGITTALMPEYQTACVPEAPRSNECKLEDVGAVGPVTFDLTIDCIYGQVCQNLSVGETKPCVVCDGSNTGTCFKNTDGTVTSNCCNGYMCPDSMSSNQTQSCIPGNEKVFELLKTISGMLLPLGIILGMILIIGNGYKLMTSQGDPQKLQEGKDGLTSAIIGLLFILMAVSILRVIIKALITGDTDPFST